MSVITDVLLITNFDEHDAVEMLNAWCRDHDGRQQQFARLNEDAAGGNKVFTSEMWAMAGNHFPWRELAAALPSFGWRWPEEVVLVVNYEHDEETHVFRGDGRRAAWVPAPCPTCSGPVRETVGMVCQTCGTDYAAVVDVTPDPRLHAHEPDTPIPADCPECALKRIAEQDIPSEGGDRGER